MLTPATHTVAQVIALFQLAPLPHEGGWFRRLHEAPVGCAGPRRAWSSILALITPENFSALHRMDADELWIFQAGDALEMLCLNDAAPERSGRLFLGPHEIAGGPHLQQVIAGGTWQGARVVPGGKWALVSCISVPEFRWEGFALGDRADLTGRHPRWGDLIRELTRS